MSTGFDLLHVGGFSREVAESTFACEVMFLLPLSMKISEIARTGVPVLFQGSIGRTDFPRGDHATLIRSITTQLWPLGDEMQFVPGHGPMSTFGEERRSNPFVGDAVTVGEMRFEVRHCPGHTPGHVIFASTTFGVAFVGDVLFKGSIGRTDFPRGDHATLIRSITTQLWPLGDAMQFVPGHGPMSTFGAERRSNPFVGDEALRRR